MLRFLPVIDVYEHRLKMSGRTELIFLFLWLSLSLLMESINSNQNNLNRLWILQPFDSFFTLPLYPFYSPPVDAPTANDDGGTSHVAQRTSPMQESTQQQQQAAHKAISKWQCSWTQIHRLCQSKPGRKSVSHSFVHYLSHYPPNQSLTEYLVVVTALPSIWGLKKERDKVREGLM